MRTTGWSAIAFATIICSITVSAVAYDRRPVPADILSIAARGPRTNAERALLYAASSRSVIPGYTVKQRCGFCQNTAAQRYFSEYTPSQREYLLSIADRDSLIQKSAVTPSGHFRVHWDTTGINCPDLTDENANGIPDYIDGVMQACDSAWSMEIVTLGYPAPPSDGVLGGDDKCDVYVEELSGQVYGATYRDASMRLPIDGPANRYPCCIKIDNNFQEFGYSTHGIDAARVTIAHEFFHVIQIGDYGIWDNQKFVDDCDASGFYANRFFFEMSSVWMETVVYPSIRDYLLSDAPALFTGVPNTSFHNIQDLQFGLTPCGDLGYSLVLFWRFGVRRTGNDATLVKSTWQNYRTMPPLQAMDGALRSRGNSLADAWCDFTHCLLFTGKRSIDTLSCFEAWEASALPRMNMRQSFSARPDFISDSARVMSAVYYSFSIGANKDSMYAVITNRDTVRGFKRDTSKQWFRMDISSDLKETFQPNEMGWCTLLTNAEADISGTPPFPDPFLVDGVRQIFFPVRADKTPPSIELRIFTESGTLAYSMAKAIPQTRSGKLGVAWDGRRNDGTLVNSGVYIYSIGFGDAALVGKIAVVRK